MVKKILLIFIAVLILIQFFRIDKSNPEVDKSLDLVSVNNPPEKVKELLVNVCYDCHSNAVIYPWYSNIAPVSWILKNHVEEGREHLNFSIWETYSEEKKAHKMEECVEEVEEGEMPLKAYAIMHTDAKLSTQDRKMLEEWFKSKM